jgi:hypothetical protein
VKQKRNAARKERKTAQKVVNKIKDWFDATHPAYGQISTVIPKIADVCNIPFPSPIVLTAVIEKVQKDSGYRRRKMQADVWSLWMQVLDDILDLLDPEISSFAAREQVFDLLQDDWSVQCKLPAFD